MRADGGKDMDDTIEGAFINEMREYQPFAKVTDKNIQDIVDRAKRIKKRNPQLTHEVIAEYYRLAYLEKKHDHNQWTGECNDEAANGLVSAIQQVANSLWTIADSIKMKRVPFAK